MAVMFQSRNGGSSRGKKRLRPMAEINVTPFVDVMLVLLIVFMVAAPLLTVGVPVDLPQTRSNPLQGEDEPLAVTIRADKTVFVQDTQVEPNEIVPLLLAISDNNRELRIFLRADRAVDYGTVMNVMGRMNAAGFTRIGLVTESVIE
jgi:biopolymer transport protein TolR